MLIIFSELFCVPVHEMAHKSPEVFYLAIRWLYWASLQRILKNLLSISVKLKQVFDMWKTRYDQAVIDRLKTERAVSHHRKLVLRQVWQTWQEHNKLSIRTQVSGRYGGRSRSYLVILWWGDGSSVSISSVLQHVCVINNHCNIKNVVIQLLRRQCLWLHNTRLTAMCFLRWREAYSEAQTVHANTNLALWQWSLMLQRKVSNQ